MRLVQIRARGDRRRGRFGPLDEPMFCRLPFTEVNVMEDGSVYPNCCPDWVEFPLGNLAEQPWEEVWNGPQARELRRSALDGDLRHCDRNWCPHLQNARKGIDDHNVVPLSRRDELTLPVEVAKGALTVGTGPTNVGMHYDWSCNLACPTCRDEVQAVRGTNADRMRGLHRAVEGGVLTHASAISLTGTGDPFASGFLREFLTSFDPGRFPTIHRIHLHTNAIMWTPALWARMKGLHQVEVTTDISIDAATPETYHVVRRPARWDQLLENLDFIVTIPNLRTIGISMTVSRLNLTDLLGFHDFGEELAERCPDKFVFVEYKRVRRRPHHDGPAWRSLALEHADHAERHTLLDDLRDIDRRRTAGLGPEIRTNLGEFLELAD